MSKTTKTVEKISVIVGKTGGTVEPELNHDLLVNLRNFRTIKKLV